MATHTIAQKREFALAFIKANGTDLETEKRYNLRVFECSCSCLNYDNCIGLVAWRFWPDEFASNPMTLEELGL